MGRNPQSGKLASRVSRALPRAKHIFRSDAQTTNDAARNRYHFEEGHQRLRFARRLARLPSAIERDIHREAFGAYRFELIQCAGATRAVLLSLDSDKRPHIAIDSDQASQDLPHDVVACVVRSQEVLVLDSGDNRAKVQSDPYIQRVQPKAMMCDPIVLQGQIKGVIYLENIYTSDVFSADKLVSVRLLATQAVISLENARLLEDLEATVFVRTREVDAAHQRLIKLERESTEVRMAGGFAHEMRNALSAASMVMDSLEAPDGKSVETDPVTLTTTLALVNHSIKRGLHIVSQVLTYAEVSEGNRGNVRVDLARLVAQVTHELQTKLAHVDVVAHVPDTLQWALKQEHAYTIVQGAGALAWAWASRVSLPSCTAGL